MFPFTKMFTFIPFSDLFSSIYWDQERYSSSHFASAMCGSQCNLFFMHLQMPIQLLLIAHYSIFFLSCQPSIITVCLVLFPCCLCSFFSGFQMSQLLFWLLFCIMIDLTTDILGYLIIRNPLDDHQNTSCNKIDTSVIEVVRIGQSIISWQLNKH